jgi:CHAT domain-containing protein
MALAYQGFIEDNLTRVLGFGSERQRLFYVASIQGLWHPYCMLVAVGDAQGLARSVLHLKGIVLDTLIEDLVAAARSQDPSVRATLDQLAEAGMRGRPESVARDFPEQDASAVRAGQLESELADHFRGTSRTRRALTASPQKVGSSLAKDTALLEYIRYPHYQGQKSFEPRYGAVLICNPSLAFRGGKPGEPVWVPLGPAEAIERNLKEYTAAMRGEKRSEVGLLRTLYTQLFEPIRKRLPNGIATLVISPDAELNFMSFATLVDEQDKFLAEQYTITCVASGRDLVFGRAGKKGSRRLAAFANPAFGEKPALVGVRETNVVHLAMSSADQRDYAGVTLAPLPNTLQEAEFLRERSSAWNMQGVMYAGAEATEAEVKAVKSPYILHLATHGFFLPDTLPTNQPAMDTRLLGQERMPVVLHNPMQRSGLAFAGAQLTLDAWKRGETPDPENDGILMAQEVGTMDLKETWLVVLSACDTGVGEARAGEGVLGLRRGFIQAGAQNLVMTLWPVSDKWTVEMMKAFYERALKDGDAPGALAQVQREYLVKLREEKNPVTAARLAGPFVLTFQGGQPQ